MKYIPIAVCVLFLASVLPAEAQDKVHPEVSSRFSLDLGLFFPERELKFEAAASASASDSINFGETFGLEKHDQTFAIDFKWRFGDKWSLSAQHFEASGEGAAELGEDVEWNDLVFDAGTNVEASTEFAMYRVFFGRSLAKTDNVDFGIGAGLHWLDISAEIAGSVLVNNTVTFRRETVNSSGPLPNIGGWYIHSLSPRWVIKARADWFKASIDEYDGRLVNFQLGINYALFRHAGIGVAYNHFEFDAGVKAPNWRGAADLAYTGPFAFVNVYW
ncbi:MAG: hypothetical protein ACU85U_20020 [Gammaproteobacteria bacterium]